MPKSPVSVALVTHAPLGSALKAIAEHIYGEHVDLTVIDVLPGACAEKSTDSLLTRIKMIDQGAGVLLLTDLPGASPANICRHACDLAREMGVQCDVLAGVNASMVLRAMNHRAKGLSHAAEAALEGAKHPIGRLD